MRVYALLLIGILAVPSAFASDGVPRLLRFKHNPDIASWLDESAAFDSTGRLREDLWFSTAVRENAKRNASGTCTYFVEESPLETFADSSSLRKIAENAHAVLSGDVVSTSRGFFHGIPGTLVGFRVTDTVALSVDAHAAPVDTGSLRFTFIPKAEIPTPHGVICSRTSPAVTLPEPGDTILISSYLPPPDEEGLIFPIDSPRHLVVERKGQRVFTPKGLGDDLSETAIREAIHHIREIGGRAQRQRE